jgi:hypothetical protein
MTTYTNKRKIDVWGYNMEKLTCRFCNMEFAKGWNQKEGANGMDMLIMHVRKHHTRNWNKIRRYSIGTTQHKEKHLVELSGAYQHIKMS